MNLANFESAIEDYSALLEIRPHNTLVQREIQQARLELGEMKQREKSIYFNMFDKVGTQFLHT